MNRITKADLEQALTVINRQLTYKLTLDWAYGGVKLQKCDKDDRYILRDIGPRGTKREIYNFLVIGIDILGCT